MKIFSRQRIRSLLATVMSAFLATGLTYGFITEIKVFLTNISAASPEAYYGAFIQSYLLESSTFYAMIAIALFSVFSMIITPIINQLFAIPSVETKPFHNRAAQDIPPLTHEDYTLEAIMNRLRK
ncbi:hypothetical protein [Shewanella sp.]|uniref:hypothetical protein n=1 Tax=Shewanella sp. TaxID=50422 RepID=UPI0040548665